MPLSDLMPAFRIAVLLTSTTGLLLAYFSGRKAQCMLMWTLACLFLGLSGLVIHLGFVSRLFTETLRFILVLTAVNFYLVGVLRFRSGERNPYSVRSVCILVSVVTGVFVAVISVPGTRAFSSAAISLTLAAGHGAANFHFSRSGRRLLTAQEKVFLLLNDFLLVTHVFHGGIQAYGELGNRVSPLVEYLPMLLLVSIHTLLIFSIIILSQGRLWDRIQFSETALDRSYYLTTSSVIYGAMRRSLVSPIGNTVLALSHLEHESDPEHRNRLINSARKNVETVSDAFSRMERLVMGSENSGSSFIQLKEILDLVTEIASRAGFFADVTIADVTAGESLNAGGLVIQTHPDVLFHGLMSILEIAVRRNWIETVPPVINLETLSSPDAPPDTVSLLVSGILIPQDLLSLDHDILETLSPDEARDLRVLKSIVLSFEETLSAGTTILKGSVSGLRIDLKAV